MLTYAEMYRCLFSRALDDGNDMALSLLNEWFDLSDGHPLTAGQTKRLVYLSDYIRESYHITFG